MDPTTERRLRDADPLARRTPDKTHDLEWLRETAHSVTTQTIDRPPRSRRPRAVTLVPAATVVLAAAAGGFLLFGGGDGDGDGATAAAPTVTDLTMPPGDVMQSCIAFSVETLAPMQVAFGGEVVEKTDDEILIDGKGQGFTRLHENAPKFHLGRFAKQHANDILVADRHAAACDEEIN